MCCLFTTLVLLGPRIAGLLWWLISPVRWNLAFGSIIWPILGLIFVPWTTIMYVLVAPGGVVGFDWLWLGLSVVADLGMYAGGGYGNRDRLRSA
jgi:hypothetical protein